MVWLNSLGLDLNSSIYKLCVLEKVIHLSVCQLPHLYDADNVPRISSCFEPVTPDKALVNVSKSLLLVLVTQLRAFKRLMSCFCLEGPRLGTAGQPQCVWTTQLPNSWSP